MSDFEDWGEIKVPTKPGPGTYTMTVVAAEPQRIQGKDGKEGGPMVALQLKILDEDSEHRGKIHFENLRLFGGGAAIAAKSLVKLIGGSIQNGVITTAEGESFGPLARAECAKLVGQTLTVTLKASKSVDATGVPYVNAVF